MLKNTQTHIIMKTLCKRFQHTVAICKDPQSYIWRAAKYLRVRGTLLFTFDPSRWLAWLFTNTIAFTPASKALIAFCPKLQPPRGMSRIAFLPGDLNGSQPLSTHSVRQRTEREHRTSQNSHLGECMDGRQFDEGVQFPRFGQGVKTSFR